MIIITPIAGLCNRMRVLAATFAVAEQLHCEVFVRWYQHRSCNCRFDDLFVRPSIITRLEDIDIYRYYLAKKAYIHLSEAYYMLSSDVSLLTDKVQALWEAKADFLEICNHNRVFIKTFSSFYPTLPFHYFTPTAELQAIIDRYAEGFQSTVGVHIRRTDHTTSISSSPTSAFIAAMEREVERDEATTFFVATDAPSEEDLLRARFGSRIIVQQKRSLDRRNPLAIQDALVDLYCLSRCRKLLGSYWSSFTDTAWQLTGIDHEIIKVDAGQPVASS